MKIIERKLIWFLLSSLIILTGFVSMISNNQKGIGALNLGIDFTGGIRMELDINESFENDDIKAIVKEVIGDEEVQVQKDLSTAVEENESNKVVIRTKEITKDTRQKIMTKLSEKYENVESLGFNTATATRGQELRKNALKSILIAAFLMLIYITFRFKDYRFGFSAVIALVHDILIVLSIYAIFRVPINNAFVAAMLTIVGYSINDTIVVFDRVRENIPKVKKNDLKELVNKSVNQTMTRSINTSITTLLSIVMLFIIGVSSIREFAFPLIAGIISGTYSSIFIASPVWEILKRKEINS